MARIEPLSKKLSTIFLYHHKSESYSVPKFDVFRIYEFEEKPPSKPSSQHSSARLTTNCTEPETLRFALRGLRTLSEDQINNITKTIGNQSKAWTVRFLVSVFKKKIIFFTERLKVSKIYSIVGKTNSTIDEHNYSRKVWNPVERDSEPSVSRGPIAHIKNETETAARVNPVPSASLKRLTKQVARKSTSVPRTIINKWNLKRLKPKPDAVLSIVYNPNNDGDCLYPTDDIQLELSGKQTGIQMDSNLSREIMRDLIESGERENGTAMESIREQRTLSVRQSKENESTAASLGDKENGKTHGFCFHEHS